MKSQKPLFGSILTILICTTHAFNSNVYRLDPIKIVEEPAIGTLILDLASKLNIHDLATSDYKFRFYSPHSISAHYFLIDQLTGQVKTQRSIDREYLCETNACGPCNNDNNCTLPIQIVVGTSTVGNNPTSHGIVQQKFVSFDVVIEDKNEFAPKFKLSEITIEINENTPVNFTIPLEAAVDRDSRQNEIVYSIEPVAGGGGGEGLAPLETRFRLDVEQKQQLSLVILRPFDYETEKEARFRIVARDGAFEQGKVGEQLVKVKIIDLNDNLPVFDRTEYEYRLDEDKATPGTRLIRVHATDRDDGLNGHVKYTFIDASLKSERSEQQSQQSIQIKNLFQIDENSGWISVHPSTSLDYEQIPTYRFTVRAQDQGLTNSMPVFANVIIYLNDVNDNPPRITLTLPSTIDDFSTANYEAKEQKQPIASMEISEWTMPNTFLAQVTIDDLDSGLNGKLNISMSQQKKSPVSSWLPSSDFSLVHLFSNIYSLMTKERLDREAFDVYSLEIGVRDAGEPGQTTLHRLTIRVRDENDNRPVFVNSERQEIKSYEFNLFEMKLNDEEKEDDWVEIGRVQAADADTGLNGKVGYELLVAENSTSNCSQVGRFEVDPASGWLKAKKSSLDREVCERFEFVVVAVDNDGGSVSNRVEARLVVNLLDVNDNRPVFEEDVYRFEIVENLEAIKFGEVKARDADAASSPYSLVKYKFVEGLSTKEFFAIDEITGELYLLKPLDYEYANFYDLQVIAYDNNNESVSLNSTCTLRIDVLDSNDNPPILNSPRDYEMPIRIPLSSQNPTQTMPLVHLNVTDHDSGVFASLHFTLEKQLKLDKANQTSSAPSVRHLLQTTLFQVDQDTGLISLLAGAHTSTGIYALVVRITDATDDTFQFNTRAYIFLALTSPDEQLATEISDLRGLVAQAGLNLNTRPSGHYNSKHFNRQNAKFNRLLDTFVQQGSSSEDIGLDAGKHLTRLGAQIMEAVSGKNFKYFVVLGLMASVMICFIVGTCCMSVYWCRQRRCSGKKGLMNMSGSSNADVVASSGHGSTSPSSMTSSELVVDNFSSEESLKIKYKTINIYDNYENRLIRSPCRQGTLTKAKATGKAAVGEEKESLLVQKSAVKDCSDQLLVQVSTASKMVASTESLTSYNSSNSTAKTVSTTSGAVVQKQQVLPQLNSSPNSFRTFKTSYSPSAHQDAATGSYRTMPVNGCYSTPKKALNLPVNELFKRYEMKKQGVIDSQGNSSVSSTSPHSSNSSVQSPHRQLNLQLINENSVNQVPDYFFKDEREYKKLLAQNGGGKQRVNVIRQVLSPK